MSTPQVADETATTPTTEHSPKQALEQLHSNDIVITAVLMTGTVLEIPTALDHSIDRLKETIIRHIVRSNPATSGRNADPDRFQLLLGDQVLVDGTVAENNIRAGSRLTIAPKVAAGLVRTLST